MKAVIKREILAYFTSAIGYIYLAIFFLFGGFYFFINCINSNSASLTYLFYNLFTIALLLIPILTMRLISEEKKQKTDQVLLTSPVSLTAIVVGKYFGALLMYTIGIAITLVYAIILQCYAAVSWAVVLGNFIGLFLLGATFIAICMLLSASTENQVVAAISGFAIAVFIIMLDSIAAAISIPFLSAFLSSLSFLSHYSNFSAGILSIVDIFFFLSVAVLFVFLCIRLLEKRRWS